MFSRIAETNQQHDPDGLRSGWRSYRIRRQAPAPQRAPTAHALVRLPYLAVTQTFATLRLLPMTDREEDTEIPALRHQLSFPQRQLDGKRPPSKPRR
ncbi:hypothetical protein [Streptomyces sp. NPDC056982]|uniref:hypothetical protein n=1 Tax=Streptomyces sp. NPDC056982 TaxID=3345986 RepID=UPI003632ECFA